MRSILACVRKKILKNLSGRSLAVLLFASLSGCQSSPELSAFSSDGCTLFPDGSLISATDWCDCCFEHDVAYWKGGTKAERQASDEALRDCVKDKSGSQALADLMYQGVRVGGSPYFYNWYRWGYGWSYQRKYQPLTDEERATANSLLSDYYDEHTEPVCQ